MRENATASVNRGYTLGAAGDLALFSALSTSHLRARVIKRTNNEWWPFLRDPFWGKAVYKEPQISAHHVRPLLTSRGRYHLS